MSCRGISREKGKRLVFKGKRGGKDLQRERTQIEKNKLYFPRS